MNVLKKTNWHKDDQYTMDMKRRYHFPIYESAILGGDAKIYKGS